MMELDRVINRLKYFKEIQILRIRKLSFTVLAWI